MNGQTIEQKKAMELLAASGPKEDVSLDAQYDLLEQTLPEDLYPKHLLRRCRQWQVPTSAVVNMQATFDRVLVYQILDFDLEKTADGKFWKRRGMSDDVAVPDRALQREKNASPRGIVVSAGLDALEKLNTNGVDLGDYVRLLRLNPYRIPVGMTPAFEHVYVLLGDAASLAAAEDLADGLREGRITRAWKTKTLPNGDKWYGYCYEGTLSTGRPIPDVPPIMAQAEEMA